jgi:integrase
MKVNGIKIQRVQHATTPWRVNVSKNLFGKQIRKRFSTRGEAEQAAEAYALKVRQNGCTPLDPEIHQVAALFQDKLSAAQFMAALTKASERSNMSRRSFAQLAEEYKDAKKQDFELGTISSLHWENIVSHTRHLIEDFGNQVTGVPVYDLEKSDVEKYVRRQLTTPRETTGKPFSPRTVQGYLEKLRAYFNYGIEKGYMEKNPTKGVKLPAYKAKVGICLPDELQKLLDHAGHYIQCHIMFGAFGGLRSSEIRRMDWSDVRLDEGQFYIEGTKNSYAERWVKLTPPLMDFCKQLLESDNPPKGLVTGGMTDNAIWQRLQYLHKTHGVKIPKNGLRHSYGSHSLVAYNNPSYTATEMGHTTPTQTFKAYRKAVRKAQADEFFALRCEAKPVSMGWDTKLHTEVRSQRMKKAA